MANNHLQEPPINSTPQMTQVSWGSRENMTKDVLGVELYFGLATNISKLIHFLKNYTLLFKLWGPHAKY